MLRAHDTCLRHVAAGLGILRLTAAKGSAKFSGCAAGFRVLDSRIGSSEILKMTCARQRPPEAWQSTRKTEWCNQKRLQADRAMVTSQLRVVDLAVEQKGSPLITF